VEVVVIGFLDVAVGRDGICGGMERAWPGVMEVVAHSEH
jgi:hypothetical protein